MSFEQPAPPPDPALGTRNLINALLDEAQSVDDGARWESDTITCVAANLTAQALRGVAQRLEEGL